MTDLAKQLKCSVGYIGDVERGNRALTLVNSTKWAKALNVAHEELVELLFQDMLNKAKLKNILRVRVEPITDPSSLDEEEWDAVNELVHSGWKEADAIKEVLANRD